MAEYVAAAVTETVYLNGVVETQIFFTKTLPNVKNAWSIWFSPPDPDKTYTVRMQTYSSKRRHRGQGAKLSLIQEMLAATEIEVQDGTGTKKVARWHDWAYKILQEERDNLLMPRAGGVGKTGVLDERYNTMEVVDLNPATVARPATAPAVAPEASSPEAIAAKARIREMKEQHKKTGAGEGTGSAAPTADAGAGKDGGKAETSKTTTAAAARKDSVKTS